MKILIREKCFETNSSSSHSISVVDRPFVPDIPVLEEGEQIISSEDFGWGIDTHNDFWTKVQYCIADSIDPELIRKVIEDETGVIVDIQKGSGYIDHQSIGTASGELGDDPEKLRNFLFNKNSWLFISNDNGGPDQEDMERNTDSYLEDGNVVEFKYGYKIVIPGVGIARTRNYPTKAQIDDAFEMMFNYTGNYILPEGKTFEGGGKIDSTGMYWEFSHESDFPNRYDGDQPEHKKRFDLEPYSTIDVKAIPEVRRGAFHWKWTDYDQKIIRFVGDSINRWENQDFNKHKDNIAYVEVNYQIEAVDPT